MAAAFVIMSWPCGSCHLFLLAAGLGHANCTVLLWKDAECGICVMTWWSHGNRLWYHQCQMVNSFRDTSERTAVLCYRKSLLQNCSSLSPQKIEKMTYKIKRSVFPPLLFLLSRSLFRSPTAPVCDSTNMYLLSAKVLYGELLARLVICSSQGCFTVQTCFRKRSCTFSVNTS